MEVESEADVEGLEAPPTVVPRASFDVSFFVFSKVKKKTTIVKIKVCSFKNVYQSEFFTTLFFVHLNCRKGWLINRKQLISLSYDVSLRMNHDQIRGVDA